MTALEWWAGLEPASRTASGRKAVALPIELPPHVGPKPQPSAHRRHDHDRKPEDDAHNTDAHEHGVLSPFPAALGCLIRSDGDDPSGLTDGGRAGTTADSALFFGLTDPVNCHVDTS